LKTEVAQQGPRPSPADRDEGRLNGHAHFQILPNARFEQINLP